MLTYLITARVTDGTITEDLHRLCPARDLSAAQQRANEQCEISNKGVPLASGKITGVELWKANTIAQRCGYLAFGNECQGHQVK